MLNTTILKLKISTGSTFIGPYYYNMEMIFLKDIGHSFLP